MFKSLVALSTQQHADLRLTATASFEHLGQEVSCPLMATEVVPASRSLPIVFPQGDKIFPMALMGAAKGHNAFVDETGRWTGGYLPIHFRRYPFVLGERDNTFVLMIDESAPSFSRSQGEALFIQEDGKTVPAPWLRTTQKELLGLTRMHRDTQALCAPLAEHDVLVSQALNIKSNDKTRQIRGLRIVDLKRLNALPDDVLAAWARSGLLALVYAHAQSLSNLNRLTHKFSNEASAQPA